MHRFLGFILGLFLGLTPLLRQSKIISINPSPASSTAIPSPTASPSASGAVLGSPIISPQEAAKVSLDDLEAELNSLFIEDEDFSDL